MHSYSHQNSIRGAILSAVLTLSLSAGVSAASHHGAGHGGGHEQPAASQMGSPMGGGHMGGHMSGSPMAIGTPGKASDVSRTIDIAITDNRFTPETIAIKKGETIRFRITNNGQFVHEFNIGTSAMHAKHQKEMTMMVEHGVLEADRINHARMKMDMGGGKTMEHNAPNSVLLEPKKSAEIIWKFDTDASLEFSCNVPGHYDSGMMGRIKIQ